MYDYIIVGAGPSGLALAWYLAKYKYKILIIDREHSIGGCHRVRRVNGLWTEHGPRIYGGNYLVLKDLLQDMGLDFDYIFTPYDFQLSSIGGKSMLTLNFKELGWFTIEYLKFMISKDPSKTITVLEFMTFHNFSDDTMDYIDRLCRLTDGAGSDRYTLYEFLEILNQNVLYNFYQPKLPNDVGLFRYWKSALENVGVEFLLDTELTELTETTETITSITVTSSNTENISKMTPYTLKADKYILAIPPSSLVKILGNKSIFGNLQVWANKSKYMTYLPVTFHWDKKLELGKIWGFPAADWGIVFIVMSDYMTFNDPRSKTVISCAITILDNPSVYTNKTANNTISRDEITTEIFRQLKTVYPELPPAISIISPGVYYDNGWQTRDTAFMYTKAGFEPVKLHIKNLYSLGTHNGNSKYAFTSMESAVSNALALSHELVPESTKIRIKTPYTLNVVLYLLLVLLITIIARSIILSTNILRKHIEENNQYKLII